jgi:GNAT superfamily N-acetyltransferase
MAVIRAGVTLCDLRSLARAAVAFREFKASRAEVADPDKPRGNPHGLPSGRPIESLMVKVANRQAAATLAWLENQAQSRIPKAPPSFDRWVKPIADGLEPLTLRYRLEAGRAVLKSLEVDGVDWEPDRKANRRRAEFAAQSIADTLRSQLQTVLDDASAGSESKGLGDLLGRVWEKFKGVFRRAGATAPTVKPTDAKPPDDEKDIVTRAQLIAETEASFAVHEASVEAGAFAGATLDKVFSKAWRVDGAPCPRCIANRDAGTIGLDDPFPSGDQSPPAHVGCRCSLVIVELPATQEPAARPPRARRPRPSARVVIDGDDAAENRAISAHADSVLGRSRATRSLPGLAGATEGATVHVRRSAGNFLLGTTGDGIQLHVTHPDYTSQREIVRGDRGELVLKNQFFAVNDDRQGRGIGSRVFAQQVRAARGVGFDRIETSAARSGPGKLNGYYTWARMGYDAPIPADVLDRLPARFSGAGRVSDLMRTPEGRAAWKEHGVTTDMAFDLKPGSLSLRVHAAYLKEREARDGGGGE